MAERFFKVLAADGQVYIEKHDFGHDDPVVAADLPGYDDTATIVAETTREPEEFEVVEDDGSITENVVAREDTRAGREHIRLIRLIKASEAAVILSGVQLTEGILYRESQAIGVPLQQLAQQVMDRVQPFYQKEIQRRKNKLGIP